MSCVNRTEKKMRGYTKTRNHTYIGETERERERKGSGRGKGGLHEVRGRRGGRGIKRAEVQKKKNKKSFDFFFAAFVYNGTWKGERKRKCNEWAKVGPGRRTSRLNIAASPPPKNKQARQPSKSQEEARRTTDSSWWWARWQRVRASMNQHIHPVS